MRCPGCYHEEDRVVDSRSTREGAAIRRRRECLHCGRRFTTYEYIERAPVLVVKKDGRRVPYDRERIVEGLIRASQKRPIGREQIDQLVDRVEGKIFTGAPEEVLSADIGDAVLTELKDLDEIAYVRFASVYRSFRDLNEFMKEFEFLLGRDSIADGE